MKAIVFQNKMYGLADDNEKDLIRHLPEGFELKEIIVCPLCEGVGNIVETVRTKYPELFELLKLIHAEMDT